MYISNKQTCSAKQFVWNNNVLSWQIKKLMLIPEEHDIRNYSQDKKKEKKIDINKANIIQTFAWLLYLQANFFLVAPEFDIRIDERKLCHKDYHWQVL